MDSSDELFLRAVQASADELFSLRPVVLRASSEDGTDLLEVIKSGMDVTEQLLEMGKLLDNETVEKYLKIFGNIFDWGKAAFSILDILDGNPSTEDQIKAMMQTIIDKLTDVEKSVRQGFADLIAHDDASYFRSSVGAPAQILFDRMSRCQRVVARKTMDEFLEDAGTTYKPAHLLSIMYNFLETDGIMTQLKANDFRFETFSKWAKMVKHTANELVTVNMFYYGASMKKGGDSDEEISKFKKQEFQEMVMQMKRIGEKLGAIEIERVNEFMKGGFAAKALKKEYDEVVKGVKSPTSPEGMEAISKGLFEKWKDVNGETKYSVIVFRGNIGVTWYWDAGSYWIGNAGCSTVVESVYDDDNGFEIMSDKINLALIQPVTPEMVKKQESEKGNLSKEIWEIMKKHYYESNLAAKISEIKEKPAVIFSNTARRQTKSEYDPAVVTKAEEVRDTFFQTSSEGVPAITITDILRDAKSYELPNEDNVRAIVYIYF